MQQGTLQKMNPYMIIEYVQEAAKHTKTNHNNKAYTLTAVRNWFSIGAYICNILRICSNFELCPTVLNFNEPICLLQQEPSQQKVASIAPICAVYL